MNLHTYDNKTKPRPAPPGHPIVLEWMQQKTKLTNCSSTVTNPVHPSPSSKLNQPPTQDKARRDTPITNYAPKRIKGPSSTLMKQIMLEERKKRVSYHAHIISTIHISTVHFPSKQPKTIYKAASEWRRLSEPPNTRGEEEKSDSKQPPAKRKKICPL